MEGEEQRVLIPGNVPGFAFALLLMSSVCT